MQCLQMVQGAKNGQVEELLTSDLECDHHCTKICFSSSSTVQTPSGVIAIKNLRLNDSVLTFTPGLGAHYTEVDSLQFHIKDISLFNIFAMYDMKHIKGRK